MAKVSVSILNSNLLFLKSEIEKIENSGAKYVHIDVMDGHFVPNLSFGSPLIKDLKKESNLIIDTHLMVKEPQNFISQFIDYSHIITFHLEAALHINGLIKNIKEKGVKAGIAIIPSTPILSLQEIIYDVDNILIMSVNPGFGGQKFIESSKEKIKKIKQIRDDFKLSFTISCDGGINDQNAQSLKDVGCDILVIGTSFFAAQNKKEFIKNIEN